MSDTFYGLGTVKYLSSSIALTDATSVSANNNNKPRLSKINTIKGTDHSTKKTCDISLGDREFPSDAVKRTWGSGASYSGVRCFRIAQLQQRRFKRLPSPEE